MKKQRIEGTLHRDFSAGSIATRSEDGSENVRLTLSFSSETPYLRSTWWDEPWNEVLGHGPDECDLSRLNGGAPVLANHDRYGTCTETSPLANIGVVEKAWIEDGKGYAEIKLSRRPELAGLVQDLADGIVKNVSVGYQIQERTLIKQNADGIADDYRVTRWLPIEISLVDIPADATVGVGRSADATPAHFRVIDLPSEGDSMNMKTDPAAPDVDAARAAGVQAERSRVAEINDAVRGLKLDPAFADELITKGVSADEARKLAITKAAERSEATPIISGTIETVRDATDVRRAAVEEALLHRYRPSNKITDAGKPYMGRSLIELSRELLEASGVRTVGMSRDQIATRAMHTTSDFPYILANVANKTLRAAYEAAPQTFRPFCRQVTAADFKTIQRTSLGGAPSLEKVNEHGEYKYGTVGEAKEAYALASYGKIVALTRQTIINDDLDAFTRLPEMFGRAAADLESDTVWGIITANAAMNDGVALFHGTHNNLPAGAAISVAQLGVVRAAMRKQTGIEGRVINVTPKFLLVPAALETVAQQFTSQAYVAEAASNINPFSGNLTVIAEPRLDATSASAWYAAADPSQIDTIEYAYLEGNQGVFLETRNGWEVDGMEIKCRLDFGAAAIDFRGMAKGN